MEETVDHANIATNAQEVDDLLEAVKPLLISFITEAEDAASTKRSSQANTTEGRSEVSWNSLIKSLEPRELQSKLVEGSAQEITEESLNSLCLPEEVATEARKANLLAFVQKTLKFSVNTWDQGFMDKLYAGTNAVGLVSELLLAVLNTNAHIYQVAPVIILAEKAVGRRLAQLFGLNGQFAGGVTQPGGSASNQASVIVARNTFYPDTKKYGNGSHKFVIFTSIEGHYSLQKAAMMIGLGEEACISVPTDENGRMKPSELERLVKEARAANKEPFYVCATAGTTVLGAFDPIDAIAKICKRENLWLHVDGSYGGSFVFSDKLKLGRLAGVERADSITVNPHKMLAVPVTCSFLLSKDLRELHAAMTLPASYLFHNNTSDEVYDVADLTLQCGRKGDGLKMFLGWTYYGRLGYAMMIESAYEVANHFSRLLSAHPKIRLVSTDPLPCLQVCFYWWLYQESQSGSREAANDKSTQLIAQALRGRGFMIDFAPGPHGKMFRVVVNIHTKKETLEDLIKAIESVTDTLEG